MPASSRGDVVKENNAGMSQLFRQQQPLARRRCGAVKAMRGLAHPSPCTSSAPSPYRSVSPMLSPFTDRANKYRHSNYARYNARLGVNRHPVDRHRPMASRIPATLDTRIPKNIR
jgi:hypothetical protein